MRAVVLSCLLTVAALPALAQPMCIAFRGSELFEIPAMRYTAAYADSGSRKDQVNACEWARKALDAWNQGIEYCNDRTHCRERAFRARCKLIGERAESWYRDQKILCQGL